MASKEKFELINSKIKELVRQSMDLPSKDELQFLEKQPGTQQVIKKANIQLVQMMSQISQFINGHATIPANQLTVPFKTLEPVLDDIREKVGMHLDKMEHEIKGEPDGFTVVAPKPKVEKQEKYFQSTNSSDQPPKPPAIYGFQDAVDFNRGPFPFIPVIKTKLFSSKPLPKEILEAQRSPFDFFNNLQAQGYDVSVYDFPHAYEDEITDLEPPKNFYDPSESVVAPASLKEPILVQNVGQLLRLIESVEAIVAQKGHTEIAVDLEHYHQRSYLGLTCLIQLTTRSQQDYLIDPFPLWCELHQLGRIFHDPRVVKVLHGADSDVQWLQRDFGLYLVGLFDTFHGSKLLSLPANSYAFLLEYYCRKHTDKSFQMADWTTRPLTPDMIKYAQMDTHYLLYIYDRMKIDLYNLAIQRSVQPSGFIASAFQKSKDTSLRIYRKPSMRPDLILDNILLRAQKTLDPQRYDLTVKLLQWREETARNHDENAKVMLPNHHLFKILDVMPTRLADLYKATGGERMTHYLVKQHHSEIIRICMADQLKEVIKQEAPAEQKAPTEQKPKPPVLTKPTKIVEEKCENIQELTFDYTHYEVILNDYDTSTRKHLKLNEKQRSSSRVSKIEASFTFRNGLEVFKDTEIGSVLIESMKQAQPVTKTSQPNHSEQFVPQSRTNMDDFVAFPKEKGEQPKQKAQTVRLFQDEPPQSLQEQHGTVVSKKRRQKQKLGANEQNPTFNVFNQLKLK